MKSKIASCAAVFAVLGISTAGAAQRTPAPREIHVPGNPILAGGAYYSADPAPVVIGDKLYIIAGHDEAPPGVDSFVMNDWQLLATDNPASGNWTHYPAVIRPHQVFKWAAPGNAYAAQIVNGPDGRLYLYAPVREASTDAKDAFAIGVAVADSPTGPWRDAHPAGPIISQRVPVPNQIENIDPTVLVDDDGRVFIYWGTFGQLRGMELARDMVTPKGPEVPIKGAKGFFEASWLMKRKQVYYLLYAANNAGPESRCTPAVYHACIAYATATAPLGPWTYRGIVLKPVSSTTSHPGAIAFKGQWYLVYHTADAKGGGHFRRSVAIDKLHWNDSVTPAAIREVVPTRRPQPAPPPTRNIAGAATAAASNEPIPVQYWMKALNDGKTPIAPLPPEMWGDWGRDIPAHPWIEYRWTRPVTIDGSRIWFWADHPAGAGEGVAPPAAWRLDYWDKGWKAVPDASGYGTAVDAPQEVRFEPVKTRCVRVVFDASHANGTNAGIGVTEWQVLAPTAARPAAAASPAPACAR